MTDRRLHWSNGLVAHVSLKGKTTADSFVEGRRLSVIWPVAALRSDPGSAKERELLFGETFCRLDDGPGHAFGFAERDGYTGYVESHMLAKMPEATHVVSVRATHAMDAPDIKAHGENFPLSFGSRVAKVGTDGDWTEIATPTGVQRYVPTRHLKCVNHPFDDPVAVTRLFLHTPYIWGGNCERGIDCSGLVQAAYLACGWPCPGDSDMQANMDGEHLSEDTELRAGDLLFWKGHVAMATGTTTMIHANAHHMAVVEEEIGSAVQRIAQSDTGPVTLRLRPNVLADS